MRIYKPIDAARLIKTRRLERSFTQQDVADAIGITRQSFARIEQGHGGASLETFLKIFSALDVSLHGVPNKSESTAATAGLERNQQVSRVNNHTALLRHLGDSASRSARQELVNSGAVAPSILQMNQSVVDSDAAVAVAQENYGTNDDSDA